MQIGIVTSMAGIGGTENVSVRLIGLLIEENESVTLISGPGPLVDRARDLGATWVSIDFYGGVVAYVKAALGLARVLRQSQLQVLHCQMARPVLACWVANLLARKSVAIVWHSRGLRAATYPLLCRAFSRLGVYAIGNCLHEKEKLIRHGFDRTRVSFSYNPLPTVSVPATRRPRSARFVLGSLSRLSSERGVDEAIHILDDLRRAGVSATLLIAGDGPELPMLRQLCIKLGLEGHVHFCGRISSLQVFFSEIDVLVNPLQAVGDNGAGIGNNIIEAATFHIPVVAYDCCGIREVVLEGRTGYCIPLGDRSQFVTSLIRLAQNPDLRLRFGTELHLHVARLCASSRIYEQLQASYLNAVRYCQANAS
jgi:L-malate glycosyltransferase